MATEGLGANMILLRCRNTEIYEKYLWLDQIILLAVLDKDDNVKQRYIYTPTAYTDKDNNIFYLSYNHLGSLKAITDKNNQIIKTVNYDSFGNIINDINPNLNIPIGFAGGLYDKDTKLTKFGYREYDSYTGRWTSKDPIRYEGGDSNLYRYVLNDPVNGVDIMGLADMNLVNPTGSISDFLLYHYGNTLNNPNIFIVVTHGGGGVISGSTTDIANEAKKSGKDEILLASCEQGNDAQKIANLSGLPTRYNEGIVRIIPFVGVFSFPNSWKYAYPIGDK